MQILPKITPALFTLALSACNSSPTASSSGQEPETPDPVPTSILAIVQDSPSVSSSGKAIIRDRTVTAPVSALDGDKTVTATVVYNRQTQAEDIELTALGRTTTFTEADLSADGTTYSKLMPDGVTRVSFNSLDGTWSAVRNGTSRFNSMSRYGYEETTGNPDRQKLVFGVFGQPTPVAALPTSGKADFSGDAIGQVTQLDTTNGVSTRVRSREFKADAVISVDFGRAAVDGSFRNLEFGDQAQKEEYIITSTRLNDGSFQTTLVLDPASCQVGCAAFSPNSSSVSGQIYGPSASEVGGSFAMQIENPAPKGVLEFTTINGAFAASR